MARPFRGHQQLSSVLLLDSNILNMPYPYRQATVAAFLTTWPESVLCDVTDRHAVTAGCRNRLTVGSVKCLKGERTGQFVRIICIWCRRSPTCAVHRQGLICTPCTPATADVKVDSGSSNTRRRFCILRQTWAEREREREGKMNSPYGLEWNMCDGG